MSKINPNKLRAKGIVLKKQGEDYWIKLENGIEILAHVANKFKIPRKLGRGVTKPYLMEGDKVIVEISPNQTEIKRGMIVDFDKR